MSIDKPSPSSVRSPRKFTSRAPLLGCLAFFFIGSWLAANSGKKNQNRQVGNSQTELTHGIDEAMQVCMQAQNLPGAAIVIVKDGKTIFKRGYGLANLEREIKVDPDKTLFRIGSISKALTLLTLTRLVDDGRIQVDDEVGKYFNGIMNPEGFETPVTVENLLTHTSGFDQIGGRDRQIREFQNSLAARKASRPSLGEYLKENRMRIVSEPGEYFRYDTYGSTLAGVVLEEVTGKPYPQAMQTELFQPLGMTRSFVETDAKYFDDLAVGYGFNDGNYTARPYEVFVTTPASSIDATPADIGRLLEALTADGANEHGRLFRKGSTKTILGPQFRAHPEFVGTTHGLFESYTSREEQFEFHIRRVGHGGSMDGFIAGLTLLPEFNMGIFVCTNRAPESGGGPVDFIDVFQTLFRNLPDPKPRKDFPVPTRNKDNDLSEYVGDYYYGVFCHSGTPEEFANGAWRRGRTRPVSEKGGALIISDDEYIPRGNDVFVRSDGKRMVFFGRNSNDKVSFYVFSSSADTFERHQ